MGMQRAMQIGNAIACMQKGGELQQLIRGMHIAYSTAMLTMALIDLTTYKRAKKKNWMKVKRSMRLGLSWLSKSKHWHSGKRTIWIPSLLSSPHVLGVRLHRILARLHEKHQHASPELIRTQRHQAHEEEDSVQHRHGNELQNVKDEDGDGS